MDAKLLKSTKFPPEFAKKVDMTKVNIEVMKKWIAERISVILGNEDDVVIELCFNLLEGSRYPNIKHLQINLTGFLEKDTAKFCKDLWNLCLSAQDSPQGVPKELLEAKKLELMQEQKHVVAKKPNRLENKTWRGFDSAKETVVVVEEGVVVVRHEAWTVMTRETPHRRIDGDGAHRITAMRTHAEEQTYMCLVVVEAIDGTMAEGVDRRDSPPLLFLALRPAPSHPRVDVTEDLLKDEEDGHPAAHAHRIGVTVAGKEAAALSVMTPSPQPARHPEEGVEDREAKVPPLRHVTAPRKLDVLLHQDPPRGQVARVIGKIDARGGDPPRTNKGLDGMNQELILLKIAEATTAAA
ncbi:hypothetical protein MauCBS54593_003958 [Microsporum audouinii]